MESIGERVKLKRKQLGITQLELANKLNITDRAVSKWEQNEGNPDITLIPNISQILGVSIEYLLTGKETEKEIVPISKRELCAQKDDPSLLDVSFINNQKDENEKTLFSYIIQYESVNIFSYLISKKMENKICPHANKSQYIDFTSYIKDFMYMLLISNNLDQMNSFTLLNKDMAERRKWSEKSIQAIVSNYKITENTKKIFFSAHKGASGYGNPFHFGDWQYTYSLVMETAAKQNNWNLVKEIFDIISPINEESIKKYELEKNNRHTKYVFSKTLTQNNPGNLNYQSNIYLKVFEIPQIVLNVLLVNKIFDLLQEMNNMNIQTNSTFISQELIDLEIFKNQQGVTHKDIVVFKSINKELLNLTKLFESIEVSDSEDKLKKLKELYKKGKEIIPSIIKEYPISYCELVEKYLLNNNYKELFKFSVDYKLDYLTDKILAKNNEIIKEMTYVLFGYSKLILSKYTKEEWKDRLKELEATLDQTKKDILSELQKNEKECMKGIGLNNFANSFIELCKKYKEEKYKEWCTSVENEIELLSGDKKAKEEFEKIMQEIPSELLTSIVEKNEIESAIIKICVKFESILKYKYRFEGNLLETYNEYKKKFLVLENMYDDEGYCISRNNDERKKHIDDLLSRLRMQRNNIVHAEKNNVVELNRKELLECIEIIEKIGKGVNQ